MVVIVHRFDRDFRAHVVESWLDYYLPYAQLKSLLVPTRHGHPQNRSQRWTLLRRLLPRAAAQRVLAVLPGGHPRSPRSPPPPQQQLQSAASFGPPPPTERKDRPASIATPAAPAAPAATGAGDAITSPAAAAAPSSGGGKGAPQPQPKTQPQQQQHHHLWPLAKDSTQRFVAAAARSAMALASPATGNTATTTTSTITPDGGGGRLSPSPSMSSVASAADVVTMADLGRSDSLERVNSLAGGVSFDLGDLAGSVLLQGGGSPEAREVLAQQAFLEAFKQAADKCNRFFVQESDRIVQEYADTLQQLKAAERALATIAKHRANLANFRANEVWAEIKVRERSPPKERGSGKGRKGTVMREVGGSVGQFIYRSPPYVLLCIGTAS
jgi:hypothetical protein